MRLQSLGVTGSGQPCTILRMVYLPLPPSLPSRDSGCIQENSPVCWGCSAWEIRTKGQAWVALDAAEEGAERVSLSHLPHPGGEASSEQPASALQLPGT